MIGIYLYFNGACKQALSCYEKAFGIKVQEVQTYSDMPPNPDFPIDEKQKDLILHSKLVLEGSEIMCSDSSVQSSAGDNMYVSVASKDARLVKNAWDALKENGKIYMELQPSFFALLHGSLRDQFGVNWMFTVFK